MTDTGADPALERLANRLAQVEAALEALQDQVYRERERQEREMAELRRQLKPEAMARSLSDDARRRGL
jgi:hypothetical protein